MDTVTSYGFRRPIDLIWKVKEEEIMTSLETYPFDEKIFTQKVRNIADQYPVVYIIEDGKSAYIGESIDFKRRMKEHEGVLSIMSSAELTLHIIRGDRFNKSSVLHFEALLVCLMRLYSPYEILTKHTTFHKFYDKSSYDLEFDDLWAELVQRGMVIPIDLKTAKENLDLFKYSPFLPLNPDQENALQIIMNAMETEKNRPVVVEGLPGTGKTVIAVSLLYYLKKAKPYSDMKIAIVVPTPTRKVLKDVLKRIDSLQAKDVIGPTEVDKERWDILICDEVHKFRKEHVRNRKCFERIHSKCGDDHIRDELDIIFEYSRQQIFLYDENQRVAPEAIEAISVRERFKNKDYRPVKLYTQMRTKAGNDYYSYIRSLLDGTATKKITFENYEFKLYQSFQRLRSKIIDLNAQAGLSLLSAGYAWPWNKKSALVEIEGKQIPWNATTNGWINTKNAINEIGSIYTVHGFDLNYAGVVIADDLKYDPQTGELYVDLDKYCDPIKKRVRDREEIKGYVLNAYAVLLSRGIKGTFIYVSDPPLREYLSRFIDPA